MLRKFSIVLWVCLASRLSLAAGSVQHIVVIVRENRSFDEVFGMCAASAGGPISGLTGFSSSSPTGKCKSGSGYDSNCSTSTNTINLSHLNPSLPDGFNNDLPHTVSAILASTDIQSGVPQMDGFGGNCNSGNAAECFPGPGCTSGTCIYAGTQGAAGAYTYFNCTDLPFYDQMAETYGIADHYFPYATPSYPGHLQLILGGQGKSGGPAQGEPIDNPYNPGYTVDAGQWTCDQINVGGTQPSGCSGTSCSSGGWEYSSQVLSQNQTGSSETILGTSIPAGDIYNGGSLAANRTACVCDEGSGSNLVSLVPPGGTEAQLPNTGPNGTGTGSFCPVSCTGGSGPTAPTCSGGGTDYCVVATLAYTTPSWGGNPGSLCLGGKVPLTTLFDTLDTASVTWRIYAPQIGNSGYYWNLGAYIAHIRYGPDWSNDVFNWTQFDNDVASGSLPNVSWLVAPLPQSDHPGSGLSLRTGMNWVADRVQKLFQSSVYKSTAVFLVWDDPGGFYDHLAVPTSSPTQPATGYAPRAPLICIGPYCKNAVTSGQMEPASIVRCIEDTFGISSYLGASGSVATSACAMLNTLQTPIPPPIIPSTRTLFARNDRSEPDLVTLASRLVGKFHLHDREKQEEITFAATPKLNTDHCFTGTHLVKNRAVYLTARGKLPVDVCVSSDWKQIYWPGENPTDNDEKDKKR